MKRLTTTTFKIFLTTAVCVLALGLNCNAQTQHRAGNTKDKNKFEVEKPDLDKIRQETLDPTSKFYYPRLMEKYSRNDTVMSHEEYRYFYLGYMFQEDYDPYRKSLYSGKTDYLRGKDTYTKAEFDTIKKYSTMILEDNPFDLREMSFLVSANKKREKNMAAKIWEYRLEHLLAAIKSTGTGEDTENAWYVIYPVHEYDLIQVLGYQATDADFVEPSFDKLSAKPDANAPNAVKRQGDKVFYFNVAIPQDQYELKHPDEDEEDEEVEEEIDPGSMPASEDE